MGSAKENKLAKKIGFAAASCGVVTLLSQIDQIYFNISGNPGSYIFPSIMTLSTSIWLLYGLSLKDKPIIITNIIGVIMTGANALTAYIARL